MRTPIAGGNSAPVAYAARPRVEAGPDTTAEEGRGQHVEYEESRVWPALRRIITAEDAHRLGENITAGKADAPTRPHPHTPPKPGVLKTAGKAAARADRAWDRATGRGED